MTEKNPVAEALRAEIQKLITEGDKEKGGALTGDVLLRIQRVAKTGRELLVSLDVSPSNLASMVKQRGGNGFGISYGQSSDEEGLGDSMITGPQVAFPLASAPMPENFGMTVIREMITAAKNLNGPSPAKIVEAIAVAKEKGLDDLVKELESQLGIATVKPVIKNPESTPEKMVAPS